MVGLDLMLGLFGLCYWCYSLIVVRFILFVLPFVLFGLLAFVVYLELTFIVECFVCLTLGVFVCGDLIGSAWDCCV